MLKNKKQHRSPLQVVIDIGDRLVPAIVVGKMLPNIVLQVGRTRHFLPPTMVYMNDDSNHDDLQILRNINQVIRQMTRQRNDLLTRLKHLDIAKCHNI